MTSVRNLCLAFLISIAAGVLVFYLFRVASVDEKIAQGAAAIPLTALPKIYEELEKIGAKKAMTSPRTVAGGLESFSIKWYVALAACTALIVGLLNLIPIYNGTISEFALQRDSMQTLSAKEIRDYGLMSALPVFIVALYLSGRWVGSRCPKYCFIVVIASLLFGLILTKAIDYFVIDDEVFASSFGAQKRLGVEYIKQAFDMSAHGAIFSSTILLLGCWRGKRMAVSKFLKYIFDIMPDESRETLMRLAVEEAQASASRRSHEINHSMSGKADLVPQ